MEDKQRQSKEIETNTAQDLFKKIDRMLQEENKNKREALFQDLKRYVNYRIKEAVATQNTHLKRSLSELSLIYRFSKKKIEKVYLDIVKRSPYAAYSIQYKGGKEYRKTKRNYLRKKAVKQGTKKGQKAFRKLFK